MNRSTLVFFTFLFLSFTKTIAQKPQSKIITMDQMIGANAFVDDPIDKIQAVGFIREYHNWDWDEYGDPYPGYLNNQIKWAPGKWNFDTFYTNIKNANVGISPCLQGAASWLQGKTKFPSSHKPLDQTGAIAADPNSYRAKSHHMFQFAARYGSRKVADEKLTLAPGQPRNTGLGLIKYMEDWNEQDRTWEGKDAQFLAEEYAAMASADYDGHGNTMGKSGGTFGVKNADPEMKFVMGGLIELKIDYIADMKKWFSKNRPDGKFAADVINFHHYSWKDGESWQGGGPAKSPEEDGFKEKMETIVKYRDENLPGVEVWISEFGWDTHPQSRLRAPAIGPFDSQEVQGQWLVRSYLAFAAAKVDRAQMFMLRDVDSKDTTWFATCGLVGPKGDWTPKKSWYYVYTLKNTLKNMVFIGEETSGDPNVLIYKFRNIAGKNGVYVVWSKTKENYIVKDFQLILKGNPGSVKKVEMVIGEIHGKNTGLTILKGKVAVDVTERPVFITVDTIL